MVLQLMLIVIWRMYTCTVHVLAMIMLPLWHWWTFHRTQINIIGCNCWSTVVRLMTANGMKGNEKEFSNVFSIDSFLSLYIFSYWIFQKSGRIGTIIGNVIKRKYSCLEAAERQFRTIFKDLTGNDFNPFAPFVKQPEKFQLLKIEHEARKDVLNSLVPSKLETRKYELMQLICDEKAMKDTMLSFDLDTANMPLGKSLLID